MDNEKLLKERNEKLALWSGFTTRLTKEGNTVGWWTPDYPCGSSGGFTIDPPDFEKVDTCLKWLLLKIKELEQFSATILHRGYSINLFWTLELCLCPKEKEADHVFLTSDTLAEAIEKYVDWVKENK